LRSIPTMLHSKKMDGPLARSLREEIGWLREHSENKIIIDTLKKSISSEGSICYNNENISELNVNNIDSTPIEDAMNVCSTLETHGGIEAAVLRDACESMITLRKMIIQKDWNAVKKICDENSKNFIELINVQNEYKRALEEAEDRIIILTCIQACSIDSGGPSGIIGQMLLSTIDTRILDTAINQARKWTCRSKKSKTCLKTCEILKSLRTSLTMSDWVGIEDILRDARKQLDNSNSSSGLLTCCYHELEFIRLETLDRKMITSIKIAIEKGSVLSTKDMMRLLSGGSTNNISTVALDSAVKEWSIYLTNNHKVNSFLLSSQKDEEESFFGLFPSKEAKLLLSTATFLKAGRTALQSSDARSLQHILSEGVGISLLDDDIDDTNSEVSITFFLIFNSFNF
jgi:hypothetical protein